MLASDGSQQAAAASYKPASRAASEVCKALQKALQPEFLPCSSVAQWEAVAVQIFADSGPSGPIKAAATCQATAEGPALRN